MTWAETICPGQRPTLPRYHPGSVPALARAASCWLVALVADGGRMALLICRAGLPTLNAVMLVCGRDALPIRQCERERGTGRNRRQAPSAYSQWQPGDSGNAADPQFQFAAE